MNSKLNNEVDVTYIEGTSLADIFRHADEWPVASGTIHLSDGRSYRYRLTRA